MSCLLCETFSDKPCQCKPLSSEVHTQLSFDKSNPEIIKSLDALNKFHNENQVLYDQETRKSVVKKEMSERARIARNKRKSQRKKLRK